MQRNGLVISGSRVGGVGILAGRVRVSAWITLPWVCKPSRGISQSDGFTPQRFGRGIVIEQRLRHVVEHAPRCPNERFTVAGWIPRHADARRPIVPGCLVRTAAGLK